MLPTFIALMEESSLSMSNRPQAAVDPLSDGLLQTRWRVEPLAT